MILTLIHKCCVYGYDVSVCNRMPKISGTPLIPTINRPPKSSHLNVVVALKGVINKEMTDRHLVYVTNFSQNA